MFRSAGTFLAVTLLLTSTTLAQQRWSGARAERPPAGRMLDYRAWQGQGFRPQGPWNQPAPVVVLAPLAGLLSLFQLQAQPVVVAPAGPPPVARDRHDNRPGQPALGQPAPIQPGAQAIR